MATTVQDIATWAGRKLGLLRSGGELKPAEAADMRASLQSYYMECVSGGAFGRVYNVPISAAGNVTAGGNQHLNVLTDEAVSIDLPATLPMYHWDTWQPCRDYGWGLNIPLGGDTGSNVPRDKSVVMITDQFGSSRATYLYDGTVQRWLRIDTLALNDEAPLSARNAEGLASVVAMRVADEFGDAALSALTVQSAIKYKRDLVTNFGNADDACGAYY